MCYSAQLKEEWRTFLRHGGHISLCEFADLYGARVAAKLKTPRMLDEWFREMDGPEADQIRGHISAYEKTHAEKWEQELFKQRKRLADAERALATKVTKTAQEHVRIASAKVEQLKGWLADLRRTERQSRDARIYPAYYAPVMIWRDGQRVVVPMRYQCRPAGKPAFYDTKYPGTYNARRDNLEGFWKGQFGKTHGIMIVTAFYEHVEREGQDVVLKFQPDTRQDMLVACLWSRWVGKDGEELYSFAAITDEPPPEVAAAGHDRCIIPIREENIDSWLRPDSDLRKSYAVLDDRERPHYEHRMAA